MCDKYELKKCDSVLIAYQMNDQFILYIYLFTFYLKIKNEYFLIE